MYDVDCSWAEDEEVIAVENIEEEVAAYEEDSMPPKIVRAVAAFEATDPTELGFNTNALIAVTDEDASGWWYGVLVVVVDGENNSTTTAAGWFPSNHVKEMVENENKNETK